VRIWTHNFSGDRDWMHSSKYIYHTITTMMAPSNVWTNCQANGLSWFESINNTELQTPLSGFKWRFYVKS
jgi:hypothetical protein